MIWHLDFCGISVKYPRNRLFSSFWAGDDSRRLRDAAPDRSFILRFLKLLIYFIIDLSLLEIKEYSVTFFAAFPRRSNFAKRVTFTHFSKNPGAIPGIAQFAIAFAIPR